MNRKFTDFIIWNHIFFIMDIAYAAVKKDYILLILGTSTIYLSIERHRHLDRKYNTIEPIVAKSTMVYITARGLYEFTIYQKQILLLSEVISIFIHHIEQYDYETIHPWLHITVALNIHIYLSCLLT